MNGPTPHKTAADCAEQLPGPHRHWITLEGREDVDKKLVDELVTDSYRLVVAHLPTAERPVDPHTHGTGTRAAR
ncbi:MmcQ/YjbR family DNA-binding protein [Streptomyces justiciae]|uniref:hypothetical protein n=1 Tax=Streptomyces justiciae TaxID=2780140 RepID=UPI001881C0B3|nr:hypothetical protein [Streptomyces justiciae]MBE8476016.1 hypothetical protein [Streptomyces justiciae]